LLCFFGISTFVVFSPVSMAMEILIVFILISIASIDAYGFLSFHAFWMEEYVWFSFISCFLDGGICMYMSVLWSVFSLHLCNVFIVWVESEIQTYAFIQHQRVECFSLHSTPTLARGDLTSLLYSAIWICKCYQTTQRIQVNSLTSYNCLQFIRYENVT
jgi:hypothetical protein